MRHNLSDVTDLIKDRRTVYPENFSDRIVHKEVIEDVLRNGTWAPNHGMTQPWRFQVFTGDSRKRLGRFLADTYKVLTPDENFREMKFRKMYERPMKSSVVVAVTMQRDPRGKIKEIEEIEAVACCIQNMYLTCTAYGIGAFWSSPAVIYSPDMNHFLNIGEDDKCLALFYMGYPKEEWPKGYRKPLENLTQWIDK